MSVEYISKTAFSMLEPLSLEDTYRVIVKDAIHLAQLDDGIDRGLLYIHDEQTNTLKNVSQTGDETLSLPATKRGYISNAFQKKKITFLSKHLVKEKLPQAYKHGMKYGILIPLLYKNRAIGVVALFSPDERREYSNKLLHTFELFSALATLALRKAQLYDKTEKALEDRDFFISLASHELKTPLTTMHGYIQMLNSKLAYTDSPYAHWVEKLYNESIRLTKMVDELFDIHKIKIDKITYNFQTYAADDIVNDAVQRFKRTYPDRDVEIHDTREEKITIVADYERIVQVILNLLENGAKFSDKATPLIIHLKCTENTVSLSVEDSGKGMSKEEVSRAMKGFYKGMLRDEKEGLGIGLFLAKKIVHHHNGLLTIRSKKNKGTTVTVKLTSFAC